jgi:hypothetical protein
MNYRFSIDDNILFLRDLAKNPTKYPSLFDHEYLRFWQEMHRKYGTKFHFNIYYQTDGFNLSEMPDKWKDEWISNSNWINLSFHALQDHPPRPYHAASYDEIAKDYDLVIKEIRRFAGSEVISDTTTVHYAECPLDAVKALKDRGISILIGLFNEDGSGSYHLSPTQIKEVDQQGVWVDPDTKMTFVRCTTVVNNLKVRKVAKILNNRTNTKQRAENVELLIHEQYFRKDTRYYDKKTEKKVETSLDWVFQRDYIPVFWSKNREFLF